MALATRSAAIHNPKDLPVEDLPTIYGFNNSVGGGTPGWMHAQLIAEDGTGLGSHMCSNEGFMAGDLGILEGTRPDRHENFKEHYPDGYKMHMVYTADAPHKGFMIAMTKAIALADAREAKEKSEAEGES